MANNAWIFLNRTLQILEATEAQAVSVLVDAINNGQNSGPFSHQLDVLIAAVGVTAASNIVYGRMRGAEFQLPVGTFVALALAVSGEEQNVVGIALFDGDGVAHNDGEEYIKPFSKADEDSLSRSLNYNKDAWVRPILLKAE